VSIAAIAIPRIQTLGNSSRLTKGCPLTLEVFGGFVTTLDPKPIAALRKAMGRLVAGDVREQPKLRDGGSFSQVPPQVARTLD
jgi:hypothetical protein